MRHFRYGFFTALAMTALGMTAAADPPRAPIGDAVKSLPLFDAHVHYSEEAWAEYPPGTVLELMDRSGVAMALVSSTPDDGTIKLWQFAPKRIVPELRPYHGGAGHSNWTRFEGMADYLAKRLDAYPHRGIGEFHLHQVDPEDKQMLRWIARTAKSRNIIVHVHSGKGPVEFLYSVEPGLKIIWAHAGMVEPPETVERMMAKHKTLYADTSYREDEILADDGVIGPAWRRVLMRFADRFMIGTDTWENAQWADYADLVATNRQWLSRLPRDVAELIAYRNAERLFGRKIGRGLIGRR